jgi:hypothetical protein
MEFANFGLEAKYDDPLLPPYQRFNLSLSRRYDAQEVCIQGSDALIRTWEE